jgi:branched-chain amino acid transport system substrate-binding protein
MKTTTRHALLLAAAALMLPTAPAFAQADTVKIGLILPLTGPFASAGRQIEAAARLYMQQNGSTVAARRSSSSSRTTRGPLTSPSASRRSS